MYVLGVDPGVKSGWALLDPGGTPAVWGQIGTSRRPLDGQRVKVALEEEVLSIAPSGPILAIEGQFIPAEASQHGRHRHMASSALVTARCAGIWIGAVQSMEWGIYLHSGQPAIPPVTWRSRVWGGRWSAARAKVHAIELAQQAWGISIRPTHHHIAEAIWIARYAWTMIRMGGYRE